MQTIINKKLVQLESMLAYHHSSNMMDLLIRRNIHSLLVIEHLQKAIRILSDVKTLLQAMNQDHKPEPVFMGLMDSAKVEMQECIQQLKSVPPEKKLIPLPYKDRQCASNALFSGIIALQLFIAP